MGRMQLRYGVAQLRYNGRGLCNVFDKSTKSEVEAGGAAGGVGRGNIGGLLMMERSTPLLFFYDS